jgi:DNA repair photolyase
MTLREAKGNMYTFVTHTWNAIKGKCPHDCWYCYMKRFNLGEMRLDRKEFKTDLGKGNFIFVGSSCDMWAKKVPSGWISEILEYCSGIDNKYLFQSKNPGRFFEFIAEMPKNTILGTTIETNRYYEHMGDAPYPRERVEAMSLLRYIFDTMVTIEPILDFSAPHLAKLVIDCKPEWVNIGADSKGTNLPEPSTGKIMDLIDIFKGVGIEYKLKDNLKRLM